MRKLRCIALDDEPHALELVSNYANRLPFLEMYKTTSSPWEAIEILQSEKIDLLFLDIQMNELTGLQLLETGNYDCSVIITSAYTEYAIDGFNYQVSDYLLKPYSFDRFLKAVNRVASQEKPVGVQEKSMDEPHKKPNTKGSSSGSDHIYVKGDSKNKFHRLRLSDVFYIEGLKNYVRFFCEKENIITLQNLKDLEQSMPAKQFMRVHRSYIVNLDKIEKIEGHSLSINGKLIPVGKNYQDEFYSHITALRGN